MRVCIVGASGKLGQYMVQHALDRGYEVVGVCREESVGKLAAFKGRITVVPGATNHPDEQLQRLRSAARARSRSSHSSTNSIGPRWPRWSFSTSSQTESASIPPPSRGQSATASTL